MNIRFLLIAVVVLVSLGGTAWADDVPSTGAEIDASTLAVLDRNRSRFDQAFRKDTGVDGSAGVAELLGTLNQRKLKFLELSARYGEENFAQVIKDLEKYRETLDGISSKLDTGEFEVVVFFRSPEVVGRVMKGEPVKNYFETRSTSGSYDVLARAAVEASFVGLTTDDYLKSVREDARPKYGILRLKGEPVNDTILRVAKSYGAHALVLVVAWHSCDP